MATPRRVTSYPDWMLRLAQRFENGATEVVIETEEESLARRYRQQIYGFIRALEREGMMGDYPRFAAVRLAIRGTNLHVMHVDEYLPPPKGI